MLPVWCLTSIFRSSMEATSETSAPIPVEAVALRSAAGMWLNKYSMQFGFDSYDTGKEIWHMEFRTPRKARARRIVSRC